MNLFRWYLSNYRIWKAFKTLPRSAQETGFWPSNTYQKYPPHHDFGGQAVLNFGCGKSVFRAPNVVNLDIHPHDGVNVVVTTNKLPFADNTFDLVVANHVIEHVPNWFESFKELARVVKPGGHIEIWTPPVSSDAAFTYRDHINWIGSQSFAGCATIGRAGHNLDASVEMETLGDVRRLHIVQYARRSAVKWWLMLAWPSLLEFFTTHLRNTVSEERFLFKKV